MVYICMYMHIYMITRTSQCEVISFCGYIEHIIYSQDDHLAEHLSALSNAGKLHHALQFMQRTSRQLFKKRHSIHGPGCRVASIAAHKVQY